MNDSNVDEPYRLSYRLLENKSYYDLTHEFIDILNEFDGLTGAASYEVFDIERKAGDDAPNHLIRRFPLSLDNSILDEYSHLIDQIVQEHTEGIDALHNAGEHYLILDVHKNIKPRRVILIMGVLSQADFRTLIGLFGVYERLVVMLDLKERDNLTQLHNRQTMDLILNEVFVFHQNAETLQADKLSWIAILDIDHFKIVNDTFGHLYGDEVLILFTRIMEQTFRYTDFLFRFGGEEFLVIINCVSKEGVEQALERFRLAVQEYEFPFGNITVSTGYTFVNPNIDQRTLLECADNALYLAKTSGRNKIIFADQKDLPLNDINTDVELF